MRPPFSPSIHKTRQPEPVAAEDLAADALNFLAGDPERLRRFFDITGLTVATLRSAAAAPGFTASLLDYIAADERCLVAFAAETGRDPAEVVRLRAALGPIADCD